MANDILDDAAIPDAGTLDGDELLYVGDDPSGTPADAKTTVQGIADYVLTDATLVKNDQDNDLGENQLYGYLQETVNVAATGNAPAAVSGKVIRTTAAAGMTLTFVAADFPDKATCVVRQMGAGQVTIAGSGLTLRNVNTHTKTQGQYAEVVVSRDGTDLILNGATAA